MTAAPGRACTPGQRYGTLVVLEYIGESTWWCRCDCGARVRKRTQDLVRRLVASCGRRCHEAPRCVGVALETGTRCRRPAVRDGVTCYQHTYTGERS